MFFLGHGVDPAECISRSTNSCISSTRVSPCTYFTSGQSWQRVTFCDPWPTWPV